MEQVRSKPALTSDRPNNIPETEKKEVDVKNSVDGTSSSGSRGGQGGHGPPWPCKNRS